MPKRNRLKVYGSDQYYHLYNRGNNKQNIFSEPNDYYYFLSLMKRHLSDEFVFDASGREFKKYDKEVNLISYCLMPNHFHLLCYLREPTGIINLMRSVMTAYVMYFNKKYNHTGSLFEGPFLASRISSEPYLWHVSRYIHLNPLDIGERYQDYPYSSLPYVLGEKYASWITPHILVQTPKDQADYLIFVADYETMHQEMKFLKNLLAN